MKAISIFSTAALAAFLLDNDLRQNGVGEIIAVLRIINNEVTIAAHHLRQIVKRDVGTRLSIIETAVGVFLDDHRLAFRGLSLGVVQHRFRVLAKRLLWNFMLHCGSVSHRQGSPLDVSNGHLTPNSQQVAIAEYRRALQSSYLHD